MSKQSKNNNTSKLLVQLGTIFVIAVVGILVAQLIIIPQNEYMSEALNIEGWASILIIAAAMLASVMISAVFHEAGHLIFGLISGYKFSSFRIASYMLVKDNGKIKLKRHKIPGTLGQCLMSPPDVTDGRMPVTLYNLGGAFVNLIIGIVFGILYYAFYSMPILSAFYVSMAFVDIFMALTNGIPMKIGGICNDGYNLLSSLKSDEGRRAFYIHTKVVEQSTKGVRIKDMPAEWFTMPSDEAMKNSLIACVGIFACNRLLEEHRFSEADKAVDHILEIESGLIGIHRQLLICDKMLLKAITENRREVLPEMKDADFIKFSKQMGNFMSMVRTEYLVALLCERNEQRAMKIKSKFEKVSMTAPYQTDVEAEREIIEIIDILSKRDIETNPC